MTYGLYDTVDHCWLGDDKGPKVFNGGDKIGDHILTDDEAAQLARVAAELADISMGWLPHRTKAMPYAGDANVLKDELPLKRTTAEALRGKLSGKYL